MRSENSVDGTCEMSQNMHFRWPAPERLIAKYQSVTVVVIVEERVPSAEVC